MDSYMVYSYFHRFSVIHVSSQWKNDIGLNIFYFTLHVTYKQIHKKYFFVCVGSGAGGGGGGGCRGRGGLKGS